MIDSPLLLPSILEGWQVYQGLLADALQPLNEDQLELQAAPHLRSIGQNACHIIGARARWFHQLMGEGGDAFKSLSGWDRRGAPARSAVELVDALEETWQGMGQAMDRWSPDDWTRTWPGEYDGEPKVITRGWVIWHLLEHDLHHGGEISLTLGMHGLAAPGL